MKFPKRSDFAFNADFSKISIGNRDGSIEVYSLPSWALLRLFHDHRKLINRLRWNPIGSDSTNNKIKTVEGNHNNNIYIILFEHERSLLDIHVARVAQQQGYAFGPRGNHRTLLFLRVCDECKRRRSIGGFDSSHDITFHIIFNFYF